VYRRTAGPGGPVKLVVLLALSLTCTPESSQ
jgi:hypothetical protein